jgi:MFS family permease
MALIEAVAVWGLLRIGVGICLAGLYTVIESWLNQQVESAIRGRAFAVYVATSSGASALGPLTLNLFDPFRWELFAISAIAFALAPIAMTVTTPRVPVVHAGGRMRLRALVALAPGGVLACFGHGLVLSAVSQVSAVYFAQRGFDHVRLSIFLSAVTIAGVATQWPIGWLSDRCGRYRVLLAQALLAAASALILALAPEPSFAVVLALGLAVVAMAKPFYSLGVTIANDRLGPRDFVDAAGALLLIWAAGSVVGPIAATMLIGWLGPGGLFWHIAGATAFLAAIVVHRIATMPATA